MKRGSCLKILGRVCVCLWSVESEINLITPLGKNYPVDALLFATNVVAI